MRCSSIRSPIGKTARSNPASYVGAFDEIRKLFAQTPHGRATQLHGAGMFSFNAGDGRCPTCGGSGFEHVEMQFLSRMCTCAAPIATASASAPNCWT